MNASDNQEPVVFHEIPYQRRKNRDRPIGSVALVISGKSYLVDALVDTGCTSGLAFTHQYLASLEKKLNVKIDLGKRINSDVLPAILADGTRVAMDKYKADLKVGTETKSIYISVVDPQTKLPPKPDADDEHALLGQDFFDDYDVLFSGLSRPQKRVIFSRYPPKT